MKTFDDFKNELAVECGYKDFSDRLIKGGFSGLPFLYDEAAERYANYKAEIAHDNACKAQLQLISDTFRQNAHKGDKQSDIDVFEAIADTIKKHPQPENPYSKK